MEAESQKYNNPDEYAKYAKLQRKMVNLQMKMEKKYGELQKEMPSKYRAQSENDDKMTELLSKMVPGGGLQQPGQPWNGDMVDVNQFVPKKQQSWIEKFIEEKYNKVDKTKFYGIVAFHFVAYVMPMLFLPYIYSIYFPESVYLVNTRIDSEKEVYWLFIVRRLFTVYSYKE